MNGKTYYGVAKEKAKAEQEFEERINAGENAGLVQSRSAYTNIDHRPYVVWHTLPLCMYMCILQIHV